ncbi:MAG: 2,3-bisphosphoglycerate-independent phosphoglycerate mutase [Candidatus Aureabacteria bacterium]|nr:2,3-bisphosphoglycerate-independent phosphoglycerate mutase [Candidatus Auribacterota bacterium]
MGEELIEVIKGLQEKSARKILLVVADGLGGLPMEPGGPTELEAARTPNLDALARISSCGLLEPVGPGITPGSGPAHLALFGYDPIKYNIGRGVLEGLGIDFRLTGRDVAARFNFATVDNNGKLVDRRAGRLSTEENQRLVKKLREGIRPLKGVDVFIETVKEYRGLIVLRGDGLSGDIHDTDPQELGVPALLARAFTKEAEKTAALFNNLITQAAAILNGEKRGNMVLLRGFAKYEPLPTMAERYGVNAFAVAQYPMYRGLARLVGMTVAPHTGSTAEDLRMLADNFAGYDFFYLHYKKTDTKGEDGNFPAKVEAIEELDGIVPELLTLKPDVLAITADHSTPCALAMHSWHPVPLLLHSPYCRVSSGARLTEKSCASGALGLRPSTDLMPILLAHARKLTKFGA